MWVEADRAKGPAIPDEDPDPFDPIAPARLGSAYLQKARDGGRFSYYLKAEKALEKSLELKPNQYEALVSLAFAYSAQHRFREAPSTRSITSRRSTRRR